MSIASNRRRIARRNAKLAVIAQNMMIAAAVIFVGGIVGVAFIGIATM